MLPQKDSGKIKKLKKEEDYYEKKPKKRDSVL